MRLTLRTLLSYLDDTLEPAQAKAIGAKVAESEQARDLMERIKQVTRRRRLMTPPTSGPGGIDANTIAEYLDNDVTPETAAELEQICLASDVHLAEVAACHQILTLVLGEPALVPPTAKQRMYALVKGPESIPFRKPSRIANKDDQDLSSEIELDHDDTLRLGAPANSSSGSEQRNLFLLLGGGVLAACLLAVAVWQLMKPPLTNGVDPKGGEQLVQVDKEKDKEKKDEKEKKVEEIKKKKDDESKKEETTPEKKVPITVVPVEPDKSPDEIKYQPASLKQEPVGKYVQPDFKEPAVLLQKDKSSWTRLSLKDAPIHSGRPLVSLSGSKSVFVLATGVEVTLWGNLPELTLDSSVLESRAIVHASVPQLDADITLERGRLILRNKKTDGKDAVVRLRFNDPTQAKEEFFDITLNGSDAAIIVDRSCEMDREEPFYEDPKDANRLGPTALMKIFAYELSANVRSGQPSYSVSEMQQPMLQWQSRQGKLGAPKNAVLPPWLKGIPELKDAAAKLARDKAVSAHFSLAKIMETKPIDVALAEVMQTVQTNAGKEMIGGKPPSVDTYTQWRHAIRCYAAIDDVSTVYGEFARADTPIFIRGLCIPTLQQWLAWNRENDYELLETLRKNGHNKTVSVKIMELFHMISTEDAGKRVTYQNLIEGLNNDVLPIRTLSHWHLLNLVPAGGNIAYDPAMPRDRREAAARAWVALITMPTPTPKKDKK